MEGFGDSHLYCNFCSPPKTYSNTSRRSSSATRSRTSKQASSPRSPKDSQTPGSNSKSHSLRSASNRSSMRSKNAGTPSNKTPFKTFTSPDPTVKSPVLDRELLDHESNLSLREEEFLIDLKLFYEGIERYNQLKREYEDIMNNNNRGAFSLFEFAAQLSMFQDMLEQRKEAAAQILSEPLDEYKAEERLVLQLEEEVERLRRKLPNAVSPDAEKTIENMMQELEELENQNEADNESVRQRQSNIEREMSIVNKGLQEIEKMESEEEILQEQLRKDQEKLARTPKINVAELEDLERLRKELEERKKNVSQKNKEFVETTKDAENSLNELRETVSKLQIEYQELNQQKLQIEKTKSELQMIKDGQSKNFNGVTDFDNEIAELNRKLENQQAELAKMNAKKANLDRRFNDAEKTKKKLLDKEAALKLRRDKIDETKGIYESLRDELETKKKAIIELEIHVKEMEKKTREMMDKVNEKQDEIGQKSIMVTEAPSSSQFSELQKILSESDAGGMVSSHESS